MKLFIALKERCKLQKAFRVKGNFELAGDGQVNFKICVLNFHLKKYYARA